MYEMRKRFEFFNIFDEEKFIANVKIMTDGSKVIIYQFVTLNYKQLQEVVKLIYQCVSPETEIEFSYAGVDD